MSNPDVELPAYRCHKEVWAAKITKIVHDGEGQDRETDGSAILHFNDPPSNTHVDFDYMRKHKPQVGGYYVVYKDGYKSWSPAELFDAGYTKI